MRVRKNSVAAVWAVLSGWNTELVSLVGLEYINFELGYAR